jgi:hypothetical protein
VSLQVTAAVLLAAGLHALWNALRKSLPDQLAGFAMLGLASVAVSALAAAVVADERLAWPQLAGVALVSAGAGQPVAWRRRCGPAGGWGRSTCRGSGGSRQRGLACRPP